MNLPQPVDLGPCEVCNAEPGVRMVRFPGVSIRGAYGQACLDAHAHPWQMLVDHVAIRHGIGPLDDLTDTMVVGTCRRLGLSRRAFAYAVANAVHAGDRR